MNYLSKLVYLMLLIAVPILLICLIKDMWGTPNSYTVCFFGILGIIVSVVGFIHALFEDRFLYFIYGEPSNRNPW